MSLFFRAVRVSTVLLAPLATVAGCDSSPSSRTATGADAGAVGVSVSPAPANVLTCSKTSFTATVTGAPDGGVTWAVDAAAGTIDENGELVAATSVLIPRRQRSPRRALRIRRRRGTRTSRWRRHSRSSGHDPDVQFVTRQRRNIPARRRRERQARLRGVARLVGDVGEADDGRVTAQGRRGSLRQKRSPPS